MLNSRHRFLTGVVALAIAGPIGGLANFAFHAVAARALGPAAYGGLTSLLVLTVAIAVPSAAVQMTLARSLLSGTSSMSTLLRAAGRVALVVAAIICVLSPVLADVLHLGSVVPVVALVGYLGATIIGVIPKAVLIAGERLVPLAGATVLGVALRLGIGVLWLANGGGLAAAVLAGSLAEIAATACLLWTTRTERERAVSASGTSWRALLGPVLGLGSLWCFLAVDTVVARAVMDPVTAGWYAAAAVLARAVLFLPQTIATAVFARLADPVTRARALAWSTAGALTVAVASVAALTLAGEALYRVIFGTGFSFDGPLLVVLGSSVAVVSVINVWIHARVAYGQPTGLRAVGMLVVCGAGAVPAASVGAGVLAWWMLTSALFGLWLLRPGSAVAVPFPDPTQLPEAPEVDVSIVVPAYQAGDVVAGHLSAVERTLAKCSSSFEVIVVDDGSTDGTAAIAEAVGSSATRVLRSPRRGRGAALRSGLSAARGQFIGFIDADGDIAADALERLVSACRCQGVDGAIAIKTARTSRGAVRRIGSSGYRTLTRLVLAVDVSDTQTGATVFPRSTVLAVLPWTEQRGFAWDAEFFAIAHRLGFHRFTEVPVTVGSSSTSIRRGTAWAMLLSTLRIGNRAAMLPRYEPAPPEPTPLIDDQPPAGATPTLGELACDRPVTVLERLRPLRILVLSWKCTRHPAAGGAEVFTHEIIRRWAALGHDVTLFTSTVAGAPETEVMDGYTVVRGGTRSSVYREARRFFSEHDGGFDIIVDEVNTRPFESPLWADIPVIAHIHQLAREMWFREMPMPVAAAGRFVLEPAWLRAYRDTVVTTISDSSAMSLRAAGLGQVIDVGTGVTLPDRLPAPSKASEPTVAFVGRMVSAKRPLDAISAFARARSALGAGSLQMVGDGPIGALVAVAAARTPGVSYLGRLPDEDKFRVLAESHAIVVTSVREGWGLVVDEAAAVGAHGIGYRVPGLVDSVPAAGGTLVDPNPAALASALVRLLPALVDQPQAPRRGGAGDWDDVAARLLGVVEAVFDASAPALEGVP